MSRTLKIGDSLVASQYGGYGEIVLIERLTRTMAVSKNRRFQIIISDNGMATEVGASDWGPAWWLIEGRIADELKHYQRKNKLCGLIDKFSTTYSTEEEENKLIEIFSAINTRKPKP